jgi:ketosteroid isomerase-like protein
MNERHLALVNRYYDACNKGDVNELEKVFHPDVVHYFLSPNIGSKPVATAAHLARYWRKVQARIKGVWIVDNICESRDQAVIEWTLWWNPEGVGRRVATRGAEWFLVENSQIREIRSYYRQEPFDTELDSFRYTERGYSHHDHEYSSIHQPQSGANQ